MKNKNGFTLVELLAVIVIMGILVVIAVPSINSVNKKTKVKMCQTKLELAEQNLILWGQDNKKCFVGGGTNCLNINCSGTDPRECTITFGNLAAQGIIEYDDKVNGQDVVINPIDKSNINTETITVEYNVQNKSLEVTDSTLECK